MCKCESKKSWKEVISSSGTGPISAFSVAVAAAPLLFFATSNKRQRPILTKYSAAAATANKLLPRLFQFKFSHVNADHNIVRALQVKQYSSRPGAKVVCFRRGTKTFGETFTQPGPDAFGMPHQSGDYYNYNYKIIFCSKSYVILLSYGVCSQIWR